MREERDALGVALRFGIVSVMQEVVAFQRKRLSDHEVIDLHPLDLPEQNFVTQALWYELAGEQVEELPLDELLGALHASEHSQIAVLPLIAMCDRWDIGGLSTNYPPPDRLPDDLHLRRPPRRSRHHTARLRGVRAPGGRRTPADRRMPVRGGLPVVRPVAQMRQPQRAAFQAGRAGPDGPMLTAGRAADVA